MAAVTLKEGEDFNCSDTFKQVINYLPAYARPRFIRIQVKPKEVICYALLSYFMHLQSCGACIRWNMELSVSAALLLKRFLSDLLWLES